MKNHAFKLAARPRGMPNETDFRLVEEDVAAPHDGQVLVRTLYLSVDPYMRGRISGKKSYAAPAEIGETIQGGTVGEALESKDARFAKGDVVTGYWGWQQFAAVDAKDLRKLDPNLAPVSTALGVLGMPGMTAYFGLLDICKPKAGETVFVSGAGGAVGSIVGQIAKIKGCRVAGTAGSDDKIEWITRELGFDAGFNYKSTDDYTVKIRDVCPQGVDCYFDNVGGKITSGVLHNLNTHGRIAVCGQISQYNKDEAEPAGPVLSMLLVKQARAEGFLVFQFFDRAQEAIGQLAQWIHAGKLKYREQVVEGFENTPRAFIGMLSGENTGKMVVKC